MRVLGFHHGLRGDLVINVPTIEYVHEKTGWQIDLPIHRDFADMAPLFLNHRAINSVVITDDYEHFPSDLDRKMLADRGYGKIFNPMQPHLIDRWFEQMHQTSVVLYDYSDGRDTLPADRQQINLVQWFRVERRKGWVAFAPFAGWSHEKGSMKQLSVERAQAIVCELVGRGYRVLQIGGSDEPVLEGAIFSYGSYLDSVKAVLGCDLLLHTDTGLGWVISGYRHPQVGLYSNSYHGHEHIHNIQPRSPNAIYLDGPGSVNDGIPLDIILNSVKTLASAPPSSL